MPAIFNQVEVMFTDTATGQLAFDVEADLPFSSEPVAKLISLGERTDWQEMVRSNIRWLVEQGYSGIDVPVVGGYGAVFVPSKVLGELRHPGFDYDAQYDADGDLVVPEEEALQRYQVAGDVFPFVAAEAHAAGLTVNANIESLAHIINQAAGSGIGGEEASLSIAGNLPPPNVAGVLAFVDEVIAAGADSISAEAYSPEYDEAIERHLAALGFPYWHTGADRGTLWVGYYYSLYPDRQGVASVYSYLHTSDALLGSTNGGIFARARALDPQPETAVVVGAYNPVPCDPNISIADLYDPARDGGDAYAIDNEFPVLGDGTAVENCATAAWLNLILVAVRTQQVDAVQLTSDIEPSIQETAKPGLRQKIIDRLSAHPAPEGEKPVANIVIDLPKFGEEDGMSAEEFFENVSLSLLGLVDDALSAAGYVTVLTYDEPWRGSVAMTYVITAGGNEDTGDGEGMGPPYWSNAQELEPSLARLLDPAVHPGPVFIHPVFGIPEGRGWSGVRAQFGLPERFAYRNTSLSDYEDYHTSLLTSQPIDGEGDVREGRPPVAVMPARGTVLGRVMALAPLGDFGVLGLAANLVGPSEAAAGRVFASGPLSPDGRGDPSSAPYLVSDGAGRFLWTVNQLHHEAFTFIVGQALASATGNDPVLMEPTAAHVWSGAQTFAFAYAPTEVVLNLPFEDGTLIDITVYDRQSRPVTETSGQAYAAPLRVALDQYSLLVVEQAR